MTAPDLAQLVTAFFVRHLAVELHASPHTTKAYRDALKLLLRFAADACHRPVAALQIAERQPDRRRAHDRAAGVSSLAPTGTFDRASRTSTAMT